MHEHTRQLDRPTLWCSGYCAPHLRGLLGTVRRQEDDLLDEIDDSRVLDELAIFFTELPELPDLRRAQVPELLLPPVVGLLADLVLAAVELADRHAALPLPEDVHHLLRHELTRPHRPVSLAPAEVTLRRAPSNSQSEPVYVL